MSYASEQFFARWYFKWQEDLLDAKRERERKALAHKQTYTYMRLL
jgi:hypothetical protein